MSDVGNTGSTILCRTLERLGVNCVFGLPGSQNISFYEALRRSSIRAVLATHELAAAFMANGYSRVSGRVGVLTTIPGPGFAYALAGLAEAYLDSAAVLYIVQKPHVSPGRKFALQAIDQKVIAGPIVKCIYEVERVADLARVVEQAYRTAQTGEPGPVLVQVANSVFSDVLTKEDSRPAEEDSPAPPLPAVVPELIEEAVQLLAVSPRVAIYCGQGCNGAAQQLRELAELLQSPVIPTRSARGVLPEDHPLSVVFNSDGGAVDALNGLFKRSDLILTLGCKFSYNGAAGFLLRIEKEKLIHVDASPAVLGANYPARLQILSDASEFLSRVLIHRETLKARSAGWNAGELAHWRERARAEAARGLPEPKVHGVVPPTPAGFFAALRRAMPADACLVTDSGLHQVLARIHFTVLLPRGLLVPSDFQSMGFGLPAAIGARLAAPERPVVALIGDGGLAMTGMELLTAVRENTPLTVIVFNDGALGQIRLQQLSAFGHSHATDLRNPDFALFAESIGVAYFLVDGDAENVLRRAVESKGVSLVEVVLGDSPAIHARRTKGLARETARRLLGPRIFQELKRRLKPS